MLAVSSRRRRRLMRAKCSRADTGSSVMNSWWRGLRRAVAAPMYRKRNPVCSSLPVRDPDAEDDDRE